MGHDLFLQAILENPADDGLRLVYADWLEERGDVRSQYLRLEAELTSGPLDAGEPSAIRKRMMKVRSQVDPVWVAYLEQPGVLRANLTPYPTTWAATDLGDYRPCDGTYCQFPYASLPPLPVELFTGDYGWLRDKPVWEAREEPGELRYLKPKAAEFRLTLPEVFASFMQDVSLQNRIRSCTGCYFALTGQTVGSPGIVASPGKEGYLVPFLFDSQSCCFWYLYLTREKFHCVLTSSTDYGRDFDDKEDRDEEEVEEPATDLCYCAPSFEAFIYRFWIENEIWYALHDRPRAPLTAEQEAYLHHYREDR